MRAVEAGTCGLLLTNQGGEFGVILTLFKWTRSFMSYFVFCCYSSYLYVSHSGFITSVREEKVDFSAIDCS